MYPALLHLGPIHNLFLHSVAELCKRPAMESRSSWVYIMVSYQIIAPPSLGPDISVQDSQGLVKPFPFFRWCALASESSGTAPRAVGLVIVHAYNAAEVMPPAILLVFEIFARWGGRLLVRRRRLSRVRRKERIGDRKGNQRGTEIRKDTASLHFPHSSLQMMNRQVLSRRTLSTQHVNTCT